MRRANIYLKDRTHDIDICASSLQDRANTVRLYIENLLSVYGIQIDHSLELSSDLLLSAVKQMSAESDFEIAVNIVSASVDKLLDVKNTLEIGADAHLSSEKYISPQAVGLCISSAVSATIVRYRKIFDMDMDESGAMFSLSHFDSFGLADLDYISDE